MKVQVLKILITGASGFIGSNLVRSLAEKHTVYAVVRKKKKFVGTPQVNVIEADLSRQDFVEKLPSGINTVLHLAQSSRYRHFPDGVEDMISININSTGLLLDWARRSEVKHFVFSSTANVYAQTGEKFTEQSATIPNSYYGASKLAAELLVSQYAQFFTVDILRLFTVYGPGQRGMLIANIIELIKSRREITLAQGSGLFLTPLFICDVVKIIDKIIHLPGHKRNSTPILNICGSDIVSLAEIVDVLSRLLGADPITTRTKNEVLRLTGSNELLQDRIGSYEFISMEKGLSQTI